MVARGWRTTIMTTTTTTRTSATTTVWAVVLLLLLTWGAQVQAKEKRREMKYLWGNALETMDTKGPSGKPYPRDLIDRLYNLGEFGPVKGVRRGRTLHPTMDPAQVRSRLLRNFEAANSAGSDLEGRGISDSSSFEVNGVKANVKVSAPSSIRSTSPSTSNSKTNYNGTKPACELGPPARLCPTRYNTTAPMYGVSLTSGQPVTIVQKFPDLLQQVIFEVCQTDECEVVRGSCVQTYVPYLFLVIPLGPVTLTGQDYVLVESGCVCQPKYFLQNKKQPSPTDAISG